MSKNSHISSSSSLSPLLSPIHIFYHMLPHAAPGWCHWAASVTSDSSHPLAPNTKYTSGTCVEGGELLPSPRAAGQEEEKREEQTQSCLALQKAKQHIFCLWKMFMPQLFFFFCIIWHLNENLTNV